MRRRPDRHDVRAAGHRVTHGVGDLGAPVADVGDDRPAGTVEDPPSVGGEQPAAVAADDLRPDGARDEVDPVDVGSGRIRHSLPDGQMAVWQELPDRWAGGHRGSREAEDPFAEDVAHHVRGAPHDRVAGGVDEALGDVAPQRRLGAVGPPDELGDVLLVLGAEALRRRREPGRRLLQDLTGHEDAPDPVLRLEAGDLLAHERIGRVDALAGQLEQGVVGHQPVDAAALVLELAHRLLEGVALDADEVDAGHADVGEEHLAEVAVRRHVGDRADLDARRGHRHDDLADAGVRRPLRRRAADAVAVVGDGRERRPDLLAVDDPVVAVAAGRRLQRRQVAAGLGLRHPDAPRRVAGEDPGQELGLLVVAAVGDQRRAHLAVGEPHRGDRRTGRDQLLGDDQAIDGRASAAAELGGPGQPDPAEGGHLLGELVGVAVDPRVVEASEPSHRVGGHVPGLGAEGELLGGPVEVHRRRWYGAGPCAPYSEAMASLKVGEGRITAVAFSGSGR